MAYVKQNFVKGQILTAEHMNHIEDGIVAAADAQSLGGKAPAYYLQPRNLLDNSDFTNAVNQRGASSYSGNFVRSIDRWLTAEGPSGSVSVKIEDGGITFTTSGGGTVYLIQRFEKGYLDLSKQHTIVAYMADGTVSFNGYIDTSEETMDGVNVTFPSGSKIKCVALYEGVYTADTLPPYVPKGYAAELAECQRYYLRLYENRTMLYGNSGSSSGTGARLFLPTPVPMRINPTVSAFSVGVSRQSGVTNNATYTPTSANVTASGIGFYGDFSSAISSSPTYVAVTATIQAAAVELSADL